MVCRAVLLEAFGSLLAPVIPSTVVLVVVARKLTAQVMLCPGASVAWGEVGLQVTVAPGMFTAQKALVAALVPVLVQVTVPVVGWVSDRLPEVGKPDRLTLISDTEPGFCSAVLLMRLGSLSAPAIPSRVTGVVGWT